MRDGVGHTPAPPRILRVAGGAVFVLGGPAVTAGYTRPGRVLASAAGVGIVVGLAAVTNWVAFGDGPRGCSGGMSLPFVSWGGPRGDLECRIAFGYAAAMMNAIAVLALGHAAANTLGESAPTRAVVKLAETALVVVLLPLLAIALVIALLTGLGSWVRGRIGRRRGRRTGGRGDPPGTLPPT